MTQRSPRVWTRIGGPLWAYSSAVVFPKNVWGFLGQLFAALSVFALLQNAFDFGLSATFELVLSVYIRAVDLSVGLLDPAIRKAIAFVGSLLNWPIAFGTYWRYVFVVLQILFVRDAMTAFSDGRQTLALVRIILGTIVSIIMSVMVLMPSGLSPVRANMWIAVAQPAALLLYDLLMYALMTLAFFKDVDPGEKLDVPMSRWRFFCVGIRRSFERLLIVTIPSVSIFLLPTVRALEAPAGGILAMMAGAVANAAYWITKAASYAVIETRKGKRFRDAFFEAEAGRFGFAVLGVLFWFSIFCVMNAGGRLLEL